jgi:hypothetical protein
MAFLTKHILSQPVPVSIPLYNSGDSEKQMNVTYDLYSWDAASSENKIESKMEQVTVPAKSEVQLRYVIDKPNTPVYYLSITAEPSLQDLDNSVFKEKSISNIRLAIDDLSKTRLNYVGVNQYPFKKDTETTLFTCFHNTSEIESSENSRVVSVLYDMRKRELARTEFLGKANPNIAGIIQNFKPKRNISEFMIESTLYNEKGEIIDKVEKKYSCQDINPELCASDIKSTLLAVLVLFLVLISLAFLLYKRKTINLTRV